MGIRRRWTTTCRRTLFIIAAMAVPAFAAGEDQSTPVESPTVQKTAERLHFTVPPDWPIEKRGGVMAPIPIEEYLGRKFNAMESQLQSLEQRVNGFDLRLRALEEQSKKERQGLRSSESGTSQ